MKKILAAIILSAIGFFITMTLVVALWASIYQVDPPPPPEVNWLVPTPCNCGTNCNKHHSCGIPTCLTGQEAMPVQ